MSSSRRKLTIALCLTLLVATGFIAWKSFYIPEPVYNGNRLTNWVEQWKTNRWNVPKTSSNRAAEKEAETAIQAIGTNGIPFLLHSFRVSESKFRVQARRIIPRSWHDRLHLKDQTGRQKEIGANGLAALGKDARPAIPELIEMVHSPDYSASYLAVWTLGTPGVADKAAAPILIECVTNRDQSIRIDAINGLGWVPGASEIIVPALLRHLPFAQSLNGNGEVCAIVNALGMHFTNSVSAVPAIVSLLHDPDFTVRSHITNSLVRIDKTTAERLGIHSP